MSYSASVNTTSWIRHSDTTLLCVWSVPLKLGNQQNHPARCLHTQMSSCVPGMSAGWLEAVVCYSRLFLSTGIWQRETDFTLVTAPPGGKSVPIQVAVVVEFSKLEWTQFES